MTSPDPEMVSCSSWGMWPASEDAEQASKSRRTKALSDLAELDADQIGEDAGRRETFDRSEALREGLRKWWVDRDPSTNAVYQRLVASGALGDLK